MESLARIKDESDFDYFDNRGGMSNEISRGGSGESIQNSTVNVSGMTKNMILINHLKTVFFVLQMDSLSRIKTHYNYFDQSHTHQQNMQNIQHQAVHIEKVIINISKVHSSKSKSNALWKCQI